ncbi:MAG TPA: hypothetical protein VGD91_15915 [Trebonia sp.]
MNRRGDDLTGSGQVSARGPRLVAEPHTGPSTGEQFAALDVLIGIAQQQDRARRQEAAAARLPRPGPAYEDDPARTTDPLTALLPWLDPGDADDSGQDREADRGHGTKTARRGRVRALGRRTLTFLTIPGARRSAD